MSLSFNSGGSNRNVNHGSAAALDNLPQGANGFTAWAWIRRAADGGNQHVLGKDGAGPVGWNLNVTSTPSQGAIRLIFFRSGTATNFQSAGGEVALDTWTFVAITFDDALGTRANIYAGTRVAALAEVSYSEQTNGTGTLTDDSGVDYLVGNIARTLAHPFLGDIARQGVISRRLTLAELQAIQFATMPQSVVAGTVLLADYHGTGAQPDHSGNGNNGTVTGATVADHAPLRYPWRRPIEPVSYTPLAALTVQDATVGLGADAPALVQANTLAVAEALVALGVESPSLTQANLLAIADALLALAAENPALTQANTLAVEDAVVALGAESVELTDDTVLAIADALVALAAESPALTQANVLAAADALIALAAESPGLVQAHVLSVNDVTVALLVDTVFFNAAVAGPMPHGLAFVAERAGMLFVDAPAVLALVEDRAALAFEE